jgi:methanogenic corrinoid protein MtbC1/DNA-binding transcriptional MerR regulator
MATLDPTPRYDVGTVVRRLGVHRMVLLNWEQQLGMPALGRPADEQDRTRRYSERDFLVLLWIRDRLLEGIPLTEAVARLIAAQGTLPPQSAISNDDADAMLAPPLPYRPRINTRPLARSAFAPSFRHERVSSASQPFPHRPDRSGPTSSPSGSWSGVFAGLPSGPLSFAESQDTARLRRTSGLSGPGLRSLAQPLMRAFGALDTPAANEVLGEALAFSSVEAICAGLLQPVASHIGDRWAHHQITMPEERFALTYIRAFLFSQFHAAVERRDAPMVFVGCGPHEQHDIGALMLALFWRHAGLRIIYLGPDVNGPDLVEQAGMRKPALVALLVTEPQRVRVLSRIARELQQIPPPRPIFAFGGPVFARNPELQRKVTGVYLGDDVTKATWHVRRLLGLSRPVAADA